MPDDSNDFPLRRKGDELVASVISSMSRIEEKVDENQRGAEIFRREMLEKFTRHVNEEMAQQSKIDHRIEGFERTIATHHKEIMQRIKDVSIVEAIPKNSDGHPDVHGHRNDHEERMKAAAKRREWIESMVRDGLRWLIGAAALAAVYGVWPALLRGPGV